MSSDRQSLRTLLGSYPHTVPLKSGDIVSERVALDFIDVKPIWAGFKAMVRRHEFDVSEMAVVTYLIAKSYNKPMVLLPAVMTGRIQHAWAIYSGERGTLSPSDLAGKRVGIRSFTTTTGAWLRGMFQNDYGLDLASVRWITLKSPMSPNMSTPPSARRPARPSSRCCSPANSMPFSATAPTTLASSRCSAILRPRPGSGTSAPHRAAQPHGSGECRAFRVAAGPRRRGLCDAQGG